jgi:microsomal dipeptidase-like Zn-dependent dipeptidase
MDLTKNYAAPPEDAYFDDLREQIRAVEKDIATNFAAQAIVVHSREELDRALTDGKMALIHAVEGGFQLGSSPAQINYNVRKLAEWGVAYITIAHLFFRQIATNAPAIPFLGDCVYRLLFREPPRGLTELGEAAVRAMVENHILIDLTHSSEASIDDILNLLDQLDPGNEVPVLASHGAYRFGKSEYNLIPRHIQKIADRCGVIGLILCDHWATDGIRGQTKTLEQSLEVLCRHIDKIAELTGGYKHIAVGTDLDGFIKPMLKGLEFHRGLHAVRTRLEKLYGLKRRARYLQRQRAPPPQVLGG